MAQFQRPRPPGRKAPPRPSLFNAPPVTLKETDQSNIHETSIQLREVTNTWPTPNQPNSATRPPIRPLKLQVVGEPGGHFQESAYESRSHNHSIVHEPGTISGEAGGEEDMAVLQAEEQSGPAALDPEETILEERVQKPKPRRLPPALPGFSGPTVAERAAAVQAAILKQQVFRNHAMTPSVHHAHHAPEPVTPNVRGSGSGGGFLSVDRETRSMSIMGMASSIKNGDMSFMGMVSGNKNGTRSRRHSLTGTPLPSVAETPRGSLMSEITPLFSRTHKSSSVETGLDRLRASASKTFSHALHSTPQNNHNTTPSFSHHQPHAPGSASHSHHLHQGGGYVPMSNGHHAMAGRTDQDNPKFLAMGRTPHKVADYSRRPEPVPTISLRVRYKAESEEFMELMVHCDSEATVQTASNLAKQELVYQLPYKKASQFVLKKLEIGSPVDSYILVKDAFARNHNNPEPALAYLAEVDEEAYKEYEDHASTECLRYAVFMQLVESERELVHSLETLAWEYEAPLLKNQILNEEETAVVFGNARKLLTEHRKLVSELAEVHAEWSSMFAPMLLSVDSRFMRIHVEYFRSTLNAQANVEAIKQHNKQFCRFLEQSSTSQNKLLRLLPMPNARLEEYVYLLNQLLQITPQSHVDYKSLQGTRVDLEESLQICEAQKEQVKQRLRLEEIVEQIQSYDPEELLRDPNRGVIVEQRAACFQISELEGKKAPLSAKDKAGKACHLFVLTDCLLVVRVKKSKLGGAQWWRFFLLLYPHEISVTTLSPKNQLFLAVKTKVELRATFQINTKDSNFAFAASDEESAIKLAKGLQMIADNAAAAQASNRGSSLTDSKGGPRPLETGSLKLLDLDRSFTVGELDRQHPNADDAFELEEPFMTSEQAALPPPPPPDTPAHTLNATHTTELIMLETRHKSTIKQKSTSRKQHKIKYLDEPATQLMVSPQQVDVQEQEDAEEETEDEPELISPREQPISMEPTFYPAARFPGPSESDSDLPAPPPGYALDVIASHSDSPIVKNLVSASKEKESRIQKLESEKRELQIAKNKLGGELVLLQRKLAKHSVDSRQHILSLERQIVEATATNDSLSTDMDDATSEMLRIEQQSAQIRQLENENVELKHQLGEEREKHEMLSAELEQEKEKNRAAGGAWGFQQLQELRQANEDLSSQLKERKSAQLEVAKQLVQLQQEKKLLQDEKQNQQRLVEEAAAQLVGLQNKDKEASRQQAETQSALDAALEQLNQARLLNEQLQEGLTESSQQLAQARVAAEKLIKELEQACASAAGVPQERQKAEELRQELQAQKQETEREQKKAQDLQTKLQQSAKEAERLNAENEDLCGKLERAQEEIFQARQAVSGLPLRELEHKLNDAREAADNERERADSLQEQLEASEETVRKLQASYKALEESSKQRYSQFEKLMSGKLELLKKQKEAQKKLSETNLQYKAELQEAESQLAELQDGLKQALTLVETQRTLKKEAQSRYWAAMGKVKELNEKVATLQGSSMQKDNTNLTATPSPPTNAFSPESMKVESPSEDAVSSVKLKGTDNLNISKENLRPIKKVDFSIEGESRFPVRPDGTRQTIRAGRVAIKQHGR